MTSMTDESARGPSSWERDLWKHLTSHVESERGLLEEYSQIANDSESDALRYLAKLLVEDEIRHHRLFSELADSLESEALFKKGEPSVPYPDFNLSNRKAVLTAIDRLLEKENEDARLLKQLQHELRSVKDGTLWGLLVDLMQRDTQKHIAVLRYTKKLAR
jgi:rubrerythrin